MNAFQRGVYLTMDFWRSCIAYEEFMARSRTEYERLDAMGEDNDQKSGGLDGLRWLKEISPARAAALLGIRRLKLLSWLGVCAL